MALIVSAASGNFNAGATWVGGIVPGAADEARASTTHTVTITANVTCTELSNAGTGTYVLNNGVTLTANVTHKGTTASINCLTFSAASPATASIVGTCTGGSVAVANAVSNTGTGALSVTGAAVGGSFSTASGITQTSSGSVTFTGNSTGSTGAGCGNTGASTGTFTINGNVLAAANNGAFNNGAGTLVIVGSVTASTAAGVINQGTGSVTITGNVLAAAATGVSNASTGSVTITGSITGSTAAGVTNASTGTVNITGNITASTVAGAINASTGTFTIIGNITASTVANGFTAAAGTNRLSVNAINALNGTAAIYAASYLVSPVPYNGYIRYANNGTNYLNQFTTDSLSAFSMPPISAVRSGVQFANNTLTGTCQIPAAASVSFGVPVDNIVGTAALNPVDFMNVSIASLTATDSLGARLKNSATVESVGRIIASFSN